MPRRAARRRRPGGRAAGHREDVILKTKTPLGDAAIVWPAGSALTEPVGSGGEIIVRQGPFSGSLDRADLVFPAPSAPSPEPGPEAAADPAGGPAPPLWFEDWRILGPAGAAVLLGLYSLVATVALVRGHRRAGD